ncbi:uncharacterized protein PV09_03682 [Verruconis gallopava]|uniref:RRM domain-containing protein n=1 Tax=Verruconis gallopava TaxID=253628 RepID=A0A0D2AF75_9PEZI|nr:uncharacterized protein PV09_03682 [Verruconis gallopava]KIW05130.1 hypothetical protein PV09_03682 [Verruconis gallopava]
MSKESAPKRKSSTKDGRPTKKLKSDDKAKTKDKPVNEKLKAASDAKRSRKRAADFIEEEAAAVVEPAGDSPKQKKARTSKKVEIVEPTPTTISKTKAKKEEKAASKEAKKSKDMASKRKASSEEEEKIALPSSEDEEEDVAALLAGFSSDEGEGDDVEEGVPLDQIPDAKMDKKSKKALEKASEKAAEEDRPGTIYVGRIPHGFYEPQMRSYFTQFGTVLNLRLARNKKTGSSKHYAFVQFASSEVADIVARTMNNYLMFGHILKVRVVPDEQIHPEMWKGANKRFKVIPRGMLERKEMEKSKGRAYWKGKVDKEKEKREKKRKEMMALGYEYVPPALKSVDDVPMKEVKADAGAKSAQQKEEAPLKAIADAPAEVDEVQVEVEKAIAAKKTSSTTTSKKKKEKEKVNAKAAKKSKA